MNETTPSQFRLNVGYRRWYQFGSRSPEILFARLRNRYMPIRRARWALQRVRYGHDDTMLWSANYALAKLTVASVQAMKKWAHGYPAEFSEAPYGDERGWPAWEEILTKIEVGFQAWIDHEGWFPEGDEDEAKFDEAMALYAKWFGALWD